MYQKLPQIDGIEDIYIIRNRAELSAVNMVSQ